MGWEELNIKGLLFGNQPTAHSTAKNHYENSTQNWIPISDIKDGVVITDSGNFIKILEILPVNLNLKSPIERNNIIAYYASYLKIAPDNIQILVMTQKADIEGYLNMMRVFYEKETDENCKEMIADNIAEIEYLAEQEALSRRFFIVFRFESRMRIRNNNYESIIQRLGEEADTAANYLDMCGLEVVQPDYYDNFVCEVLYSILNKKTSKTVKPPLSVFTMIGEVHQSEIEISNGAVGKNL